MKNNKLQKSGLKIIPLGGLGEIGKNMMVIEYGDEIILIDAGLMFPSDEMFGIDLVLPDFSYLKENKSKLKAIILTHGHEDHVGALSYLLKEINVPVYGTRLTLGLVKAKLKDLGVHGFILREIYPNSKRKLKIGSFKLSFMRVNHSIPDGVGLAITTPVGTIVHSGDFKIDPTPVDGKLIDLQKFQKEGRKGVLAFLSDSTNSEVKGFTMPEKSVGQVLFDIFSKAEGRILVASFASHIHRLQQVIDIASKLNRKVAISGRSMLGSIDISSKLGYVKIPKGVLIDIYKASKMDEKKIVILCTGSQGEPLSALSRIASGDHKQIKITSGDTVVIAATPVPGNERSVSKVIDLLFRCGAEVHYESISKVHVSGHAAQEELKLMLNLVKPKYFIPIHGEYRHLRHHSDLAEEVGIPKENIFILENGDVVEFTPDGDVVKSCINAGVIYVDGLGVGDIEDFVIRDRQRLAQDGIILIVLGVSKRSGEITSGPDLISKGFIFPEEDDNLLDDVKFRIIKKIKNKSKNIEYDWAVLKKEIKNVATHYIYQKVRRRPMIIPIIVEM